MCVYVRKNDTRLAGNLKGKLDGKSQLAIWNKSVLWLNKSIRHDAIERLCTVARAKGVVSQCFTYARIATIFCFVCEPCFSAAGKKGILMLRGWDG